MVDRLANEVAKTFRFLVDLLDHLDVGIRQIFQIPTNLNLLQRIDCRLMVQKDLKDKMIHHWMKRVNRTLEKFLTLISIKMTTLMRQ